MATLEKIRSKAGLLVVVIGIALLSFIVGDFLSSGQTFFNMSQDKVLSVNGTKIGVVEYQDRITQETENMRNRYRSQTGQELPDIYLNSVSEQVYEMFVNKILLEDETKEIGMTVGVEEMMDIIQGENIAPAIRESFTNPNTGEFNKAELLNYLKIIMNNDETATPEQQAQVKEQRAIWVNFEQSLREERLFNKFASLLSKAIVPNKLDIEDNYNGNVQAASFIYAIKPYYTIADSTIAISDKEIEALYKKRQDQFKQEGSRSVKYITVDIVASEADRKATEDKINAFAGQFAATQDMTSVLNFNSEVPYINAFVAVNTLPADVKEFAQTAAINEVKAPFYDAADNAYKMYRLLAKTMAPDSIKARHIMLPLEKTAENNARRDSIVTAINNGGDFAALAGKYSMDQYTANNGGDMGWFTETATPMQLGQEFSAACFNASGNGAIVVESPYGQHIVQITERTAPTTKAKVAQCVMAITPSSTTTTELYNKLSQFVSTNNKAADFEAKAPENGYNLGYAELTPTSYNVGAVQNLRQAVRWAFNNDVNSVSEIYTVDNKYVTLAITDMVEKGITPLDKVKDMLRGELIVDKKAEMIITDLKKKNLTSVQAYANTMISLIDTVRSVTFNTPAIPGMGVEPVINALAPTAPENTVVGPVKGKRGVIVFSVFEHPNKEIPFDANAVAATMQQTTIQKINNAMMESLKVKADIEDFRVKFF